MRQYLRHLLGLTRWAFASERGVFSLTNVNFLSGVEAYLPACHKEIADLTMVSGTATATTVNTGVVGLKWMRVRAIAKTLTGLAATGSVVVSVQAGTGAAITGPTSIASQRVVMVTGDTALLFDMRGWSNAGFQSYAVTVQGLSAAGAVDAGVTAVLDVMIDCI